MKCLKAFSVLSALSCVLWAASAQAQLPPVIRQTNFIPPSPELQYISPAQLHLMYPNINSVQLTLINPVHRGAIQKAGHKPPTAGNPVLNEAFNTTVQTSVTVNGVNMGQVSVPNVPVKVTITYVSPGVFTTQMTQLDISGGTLPSGWAFRISPNHPSTGMMTITKQTNGEYLFTSFFDIWEQFSTMGNGSNANWTDPNNSGHMVLTDFAFYDFGNLSNGADGLNPFAGLIEDKQGNLYGTTAQGGANSVGTVFKVDTFGNETVLYSFTGGADGGIPYGGVIMDKLGNLYGTNVAGGAGYGVVYELSPPYGQSNLHVLYTFTGGTDGANPYDSLIMDKKGNLYGTTFDGGTGSGVVFRVAPSGAETVLYAFTGGADGANPYARLLMDKKENLYGTTFYGGTSGSGTVFKLDKKNHETVLYSFTGGADGANPFAGVIMDKAGNLYGTTIDGGSGYGVVFKVGPSGGETVLYSFTGGSDGGQPYGGLFMDKSGNLYGTTAFYSAGFGDVFELAASGIYSVLYSFTNGADGASPTGTLIMDKLGNLCGTTFYGGIASSNGTTAGSGTVFKVYP